MSPSETAKELAALLKLKPIEVERVLKNPQTGEVAEARRKKVLDHLVREARRAQGPRRGRNLFLVLPGHDKSRHGDYFASMRQGLVKTLELAAAARSRDLVLKVYHPGLSERLGDDPAWGIIEAGRVPQQVVARWARRFPVVSVNRIEDLPGAYPAWDRVAVDNSVGMELLVSHLVGLGHQRIGLVTCRAEVTGERPHSHFVERVDGFCQALRRRGLPVEPRLLIDSEDWDSGHLHQVLTRSILRGPLAPTALCFANDHLAQRFAAFARHLGLGIPGSLSITGFDGTESGALTSPPLTTVVQDYEGYARVALTLIEERNRSGIRVPKWFTRVEPRLVVRGSTAPPARPKRKR